ncbi:DNA helicase Pif1-like protein [Artemisia annua]|uniref:DNA helicase Pif1-like protein n=1 Tax=Artemisia annua TaxID=35608 RepID=A0A2U1NVG5_ARTAN|nr:DNA helicase Pif1-like protein [Artemisia annua]
MRPLQRNQQRPRDVRNSLRRYRQGPPNTYVRMGRCDRICQYCKALFWYDEKVPTSSRTVPKYNRCCNGGKVANRLEKFQRTGDGLRPDIVQNLIAFLDEHNKLVQLFRTAREKLSEVDIPQFKIQLFGVVGSRQHELPSGDSIGAIVFQEQPDVVTDFDVIIEQHNHQPKRVNKLHASYMSLQFPLIFIYGEEGYHLNRYLFERTDSTPDAPKRMTMKMYYAVCCHSSMLSQFCTASKGLLQSDIHKPGREDSKASSQITQQVEFNSTPLKFMLHLARRRSFRKGK